MSHDGELPSLDRAFRLLNTLQQPPRLSVKEFGRVLSVGNGVARVSGLPEIGYEELVRFKDDTYGIAFDLNEADIGIVMLGDSERVRAGDEVERTARVVDLTVSEEMLGRVIDPLGRPLDGGAALTEGERWPIEREAPGISDRLPVTEPLQTGLVVVDALVPIGRGQRELILGDRQTGKTAIVLDAMANQRDTGVICIYCSIGQRGASVARAIAALREGGSLAHTIVMVASGEDAPGLRYIAPYAATAIAESFMAKGHDVLIAYDDLTNHARAYREISLLLRRPPGREAFPGDIFYLHARLLERATRLRPELGGGSITALPIVETEEQDLAAYIPTNLISITDGQLYLSPALFARGVLPAVDVGKSVSRIGGKAQRGPLRQLAGELKLAYAQFEELESFTRFGARLEAGTQESLDHGLRIREVLKQGIFSAVPLIDMVAILLALTEGAFARVPLASMAAAAAAVRSVAAQLPPAEQGRMAGVEPLAAADRTTLLTALSPVLAALETKP
jgi:F-type H+-transporting ATPase subunit alpha